jgi:hypothetical protein
MVTAVVRSKTKHGMSISNDSKKKKISGLTSCDGGNSKKYFYDPEFQ